MKAYYIEVFQEGNIYFTTEPSIPKGTMALAERLADTFAKAMKDPIILKGESALRAKQTKNDVSISVYELAKDEDGDDIPRDHILVKERNV